MMLSFRSGPIRMDGADLEDNHVASGAATSLLEESPHWRRVSDWGHEFQKLIAEGEDVVLQTELGNSGILVSRRATKDGTEPPERLTPIESGDRHLTQANVAH